MNGCKGLLAASGVIDRNDPGRQHTGGTSSTSPALTTTTQIVPGRVVLKTMGIKKREIPLDLALDTSECKY